MVDGDEPETLACDRRTAFENDWGHFAVTPGYSRFAASPGATHMPPLTGFRARAFQIWDFEI
jgi:hypothetical protein